MNILLIEDEASLAETAITQMEARGNTVFCAKDLLSAREIMENPEIVIKLVIADHNLTDGLGIDFVIAMLDTHKGMDAAIVSGCLTEKDIERLEALEIPYFQKPLIYGKVLDQMRKIRIEKAAAEPPQSSGLGWLKKRKK